MKLYVLRHGKSPKLEEAGVARDFDRPLAPEGREAVRRMAAFLREQGGRPSVLLTSPLVRARQTAEEAAGVLGGRPEEFRPLDNTLPAEQLWSALEERLAGVEEALVAGHQPQLGELAAFLTGLVLELKPGGCVALEQDAERFRVLWHRNPKDL